MFQKIKDLFQGQRVNIIEVDGHNEITRIRYVDGATREPNQIQNTFDLLGYEIRSDSIEMFSGKKFLGRGYVADLAGMTVDLSWRRPKEHESAYPEIPADDHGQEPGELLTVAGDAVRADQAPAWTGGKCQAVPCMVIEGSDIVRIVRFDYFREIDGAIIDDERQIRYEKDPNMRIEIRMPDGKIGRGFVCSPSGRTIRIHRNVRVKIPVKSIVDGIETTSEEYSEIKFAGALGKLSSGDRLPKLLSGMSGRENWIQMIVAFVAGLIVMGVF